MAYTVQFRRGTTAEHSTFTGEKGEVTFDTTTNRLVVHDGTTVSGIAIAKLSDIPTDLAQLTDTTSLITEAWQAKLAKTNKDYKTLYMPSVRNMSLNTDGTKVYVVDNRYVYGYDLSIANDLSTAVLHGSYYYYTPLTNDESHMVEISGNGEHLYLASTSTGIIYQFDLATPYDITTISNPNKSINLVSEENKTLSMEMNGTGTKMWTTGGTTDEVHQYTLSTPYDITTVVYDDVQFNLNTAAGITTAQSIVISVDGSKMYVFDSTFDELFEFDLSSAYDISTATYNGISTWINSASHATMSPDGSKLYASEGSVVIQYSLTTNTDDIVSPTPSSITWELNMSSLSYDAKTLSVSNSRQVTLSEDGTKMYLPTNRYIQEYDLSIAYDISTASYVNQFYYYSAIANDETAYIEISSNGEYMYLINDSHDQIEQLTMSTPYDITTAGTRKTVQISHLEIQPRGISFSSDGKKFIMVGINTDRIYEFVCTTPWDISTSYWTGARTYVGLQCTSPRSCSYSSDGTKMYVYQHNGTIFEYALSTPFEVASANINTPAETSGFGRDLEYITISKNGKYIYGSDGTNTYQYKIDGTASSGVSITSSGTAWSFDKTSIINDQKTIAMQADMANSQISVDGTKMFIMRQSRYVYEYTLSTPFDIATATYIRYFDVYPIQGNDYSVALEVASDGSKFYTIDHDNDYIYEWTMASPWDLSSVTNSGIYLISTHFTNPMDLVMTYDGKKIYVTGYDRDTIAEFALATPFDITTTYWTGNTLSISSQTGNPRSLMLSSDGSKLYLKSTTTTQLYEYSMSTAYDLGTAVHSDTITIPSMGACVSMSHDGKYIYATSSTNAHYLEQFKTDGTAHVPVVITPSGTAWSFDKTSIINDQKTIALQHDMANSQISVDGTKIFIMKQSRYVYEYTLSTPFDIATATYIRYFDVYPTQGNDYSVALEVASDGSKFYTIDYDDDYIYEWTMASPWDLSSVTNSGIYDIGSHFTNPMDLAMTYDGKKIYVTGYDSDKIAEFVLTTAYDITTAYWTGSQLSISSQTGNPRSLMLSSDGSKLYLKSTTTTQLYEYSMSTAYDLSSAIYESTITIPSMGACVSMSHDGKYIYATSSTNAHYLEQFKTDGTAHVPVTITSSGTAWSFDKTGITADNRTIALQHDMANSNISVDGTKIFIMKQSRYVYEYTLSTPFDIATATYIRYFDVYPIHGNDYSAALEVASDGSKFYTIDYDDDYIYEWTMASSWDLTSVTNSGIYDIGSHFTNPMDLVMTYDGKKIYVTGYDSDKIAEFVLGTPFDITTAYWTGSQLSISSQTGNPRSLMLSSDGLKLYLKSTTTTQLYEYSMSTAYDLSSAIYESTITIPSMGPSVSMSHDGKYIYATSSTNGHYLEQFKSDGTAHVLVTITSSGTAWDFDKTSIINDQRTIALSHDIENSNISVDGTKMFVMKASRYVTEYTLSTPFDVSTATFVRIFDVYPTQGSDYSTALEVASDGSKFYTIDYDDDYIYEWTMASSWNLSSVTNSGIYDIGSHFTNPSDLLMTYDGKKIYVTGHDSDKIAEFVLGTPFDITTAYWTGSQLSISSQTGYSRSLMLSSDGSKLYLKGNSNTQLYEYSMSTAYDLSSAIYESTITIPSMGYMSMSHDGKYIYGRNVISGKYLQQFKTDGTAHVPVTITPSGTAWSFDADAIQPSGTIGTGFSSDVQNISISEDGTKMFMMTSSRHLQEYTLSTPFDTTTATYIRSFDVYTIQGNDSSFALEVASDGNKFYTIDYDSDYIYEWTMASPWDLTSVTNTGTYFIGQHLTNAFALVMTYDGKKMYVTGYDSDKIAEYALTTAYDITTAYWTGNQLSTSDKTGYPRSLILSSDGSKLYLKGNTLTQIYEYSMSTAYDLGTAIFTRTITLTTPVNCITTTHDGSILYGVSPYSGSASSIIEYDMNAGTSSIQVLPLHAAPWVSNNSATSNNDFNFYVNPAETLLVGTDGSTLRSFTLNSNANLGKMQTSTTFSPGAGVTSVALSLSESEMYVLKTGSSTITQYTLSTPGDISTATSAITFTCPVGIIDFAISSDGTRVYMMNSTEIQQFDLSTPWAITSASLATNGIFDMSNEINGPRSLQLTVNDTTLNVHDANTHFKMHRYVMTTAKDITTIAYDAFAQYSDGNFTKAFVTSDGTNVIGRYNLDDSYRTFYFDVNNIPNPIFQAPSVTAGWTADMSLVSYDNITLSVVSQGNYPTGMKFNDNGTKMYMLDSSGVIYEYDLSTAFDLSTSTYNNVSFDSSAQESSTFGFDFNDDGTKLYIVGFSDGKVYQYGLSTAYDLSTIAYSNVFFGISSQASLASDITFNIDGTKMYVVGYGTKDIFQYTLSTGFDVSTASYNSISINVDSIEQSPFSIEFNPDGTKMYMVGNNLDTVQQFTLTSAFDISTATYDNVSFGVSNEEGGPVDVIFSTDGSKMYIAGANGELHQYSTGVVPSSTSSIDITTPLVSMKKTLDYPMVASEGFHGFVDDGNKFVTTNGGTITVHDVSTPYDITTGTPGASATYNLTPYNPSIERAKFNADGTKLYLKYNYYYQNNDKNIREITCTSPFNPNGTIDGTYDFGSGIYDFDLSYDGTALYVLFHNEIIYQYGLSTSGSIASKYETTITFNAATLDTNPRTIQLSDDGTKMFVFGITDDRVHQLDMTTAYMLSSATYNGVKTDAISNAAVVYITNDGSRLNAQISGTKRVEAYSINGDLATAVSPTPGTAWSGDISTPLVSMKKTLDYPMVASEGFHGFIDNGNKFVTTNGGTITVHNASTPYDITTGTPGVSATYNLTPYNPSIERAKFNADGTKLYLKYNYYYQNNDKKIREITCTSPFNPNGTIAGTFEGDEQSLYGNGVYDMCTAYDTTKMYVLNHNEIIFEYVMATPGSIASMYWTGASFNAATLDTNPRTIQISDDGTKMFVFGITDDRVHQLDMTTAFDFSTATYNGVKTDVISNASVVYITNDGSRLNAQISGTKRVASYSINGDLATVVSPTPGTAWSGDISTSLVSMKKTLDYSMVASDGFQGFVDDGNKFVTTNGSTITVHDASTPYDITTGTPGTSATYNLTPYNPSIERAKFNGDGTKLYLKYNYYYQNNDKKLREITCTSPFNPNGTIAGTFEGDEQSLYGNGIYDMCTAPDTTKMYVLNHNEIIFEYVMATPGSIASMYWTGESFNAAILDTNPRTIQISDDGTKMFVFGITDDRVHQLDMTTAFDFSTATYNGVKTDVISNASVVYITNDGSRLNAQISGTKRVEAYSINGDLATVVSPTPGTAWSGDISAPLVTSYKSVAPSMDGGAFYGFVDDGNKFVTTKDSTITVHDLSTPYDIVATTTSTSGTHYLSPYNPDIESAKFSADGTKLYLRYNYYYQNNDRKIREITCTSPFNPNGTIAGTFEGDEQSLYGNGVYDMCTSHDIKKMYVLNHNEIIFEYVMATPGSIASMYWTGESFNAATLDANPRTLQISDDGTKMFVFGATGNKVFQLDMTTAFDLSTATYNGVKTDSFPFYDNNINGMWISADGNSISGRIDSGSVSQYYIDGTASSLPTVTTPVGYDTSWNFDFDYIIDDKKVHSSLYHTKFVSNDGTKLYQINSTSKVVYQYELSIPHDISSAVSGTTGQTSKTLSNLTDYLYNIFVSPDGTNLYAIDFDNKLYHYTMSTPHDLTTATYTAVNTGVSTVTQIRNIEFNPDGSGFNIYYADGIGVVRQYVCSTPWDITTAYWTSNTHVFETSNTPHSFQISADGTKAYTFMREDDTLREYTMSTPWNIATLSSTPSNTHYFKNAWEVFISPDGSRAMASSSTTYGYIYRTDGTYHTPVTSSGGSITWAGDITSLVDANKSFDTGYSNGWVLSDDGTKLYTTSALTIKEHTLSTAHDISSASFDQSVQLNQAPLSNINGNMIRIHINSDGTKMFVMNNQNPREIYQFDFGTPFDVSTLTISTSPRSDSYFKDMIGETNITDFTMSYDGKKLFHTRGDRIVERVLETAFDITTEYKTGNEYWTGDIDASPQMLQFSSDGLKLYMFGASTDSMYEFTMTTAYNMATMSYYGTTKRVRSTALANLSSDGTKMYVLIGTTLHQYDNS